MKDKNGIEKKCSDCRYYEVCEKYTITVQAYIARIEELQKELDETEKKLTETIKLLGERSRECGELEAHNEVCFKEEWRSFRWSFSTGLCAIIRTR